MTKIVNKKKKTRTKYDIAFVLMAVVAVLIIIGTGTYAYYQSTIAGTTSGTIAKWSFKANNQTSTFELDWGGIYPGKEEVKYIELSAEDSDLPVMFELIFNYADIVKAEYEDEKYSAEMKSLLLRLYFDAAYTIGLRTNNTIGLKGMLLAGEKLTIPIYYNWLYSDSSFDVDDTIQKYTDGQTIENKITIIGRQLDISNSDKFNESLNQDLLGLNDSNTCEMGEYSYSNRYGYMCEWTFQVGDTIHIGEMVNYEFADGSVIEVPKYKTQAIMLNYMLD